MPVDVFWNIIEQARSSAPDASAADQVVAHLVDRLSALPVGDIARFGVELEGLMDTSYRWDLWGAGNLVNGGCTDDQFDHFRGWLITRGRAVWEAVLADPDALAGLPWLADLAVRGDGALCRDLPAAAPAAYGRVTGTESGYWSALPDRTDGGAPGTPGGAYFDIESETELRTRFPRLAAMFLDRPRPDDLFPGPGRAAEPQAKAQPRVEQGFFSRLRPRR